MGFQLTRPVSVNIPQVELGLALSADGRLSVCCRDPTTGTKRCVTFHTGAILAAEEVEKMKSRSRAMAVS